MKASDLITLVYLLGIVVIIAGAANLALEEREQRKFCEKQGLMYSGGECFNYTQVSLEIQNILDRNEPMDTRTLSKLTIDNYEATQTVLERMQSQQIIYETNSYHEWRMLK